MRKLALLAGGLVLAAGVALAQVVALAPPTITWGSQNQLPTPMQIIGYDSGSGQPCIVGKTPTCSLSIGGATGISATLTAKTVTVTANPTVTAGNAYGVNYVVGGKLTLANAFQTAGSGILQSVKIRFKTAQANGFTLFLFNADPSATAWTDAAVAALNAADVQKVSGIVPLNCSQQLGSGTFCGADGIAQAHAPGGTTLWAVLLSNQALSANFGSTSDVQVSLTILDD